jgi:glycerol-3-phosphate acyltransferase PlsY
MQELFAALLGYLLGSIPTGVLVARLYGQTDLTQVGSRRTGATNVLRTLGKRAAALAFIGDFLKGSLAVALGGLLAPADGRGMALAGITAVLGHCYSPFIGFKGGRGVTTGLGSLLVLSPLAALAATLIGVLAIALTRYVSLGSILGVLTGSLLLVGLTLTQGGPPAPALFGIVIGVFIVAAHHDNIGRLLRGTERRLGQRT